MSRLEYRLKVIKRYFKLLKIFVKNSLIKVLTYRLDFFVSLITDACFCFVRVLFIGTIFKYVTHIGNWTYEQFLVYFGCAFLIEGIYMFFFFNGHTTISIKILTGEMDYYLTKPLSEIFYLSFHSSNVGSGLSDILLGLIFLLRGAANISLNLSATRVIVFIFMMFSGLSLYFALSFIINILSFWVIHAGALFNLFISVTDLLRYPGEVFSRGINFIITFIIPFQFIAIIPAKYIMNEISWYYAIISFILCLLFWMVLNRLYQSARKAYSSARG